MANYDLGVLASQPLPLLAADQRRHLKVLAKPDMSVAELTRSLAVDPAAVQLIYRAACARQRQAEKIRPVRSLDQAINMLGLNGVSQLLRDLPVLGEMNRHEVRYRALLGQSLVAAEQSRRWALQQGQRHAEEVWLATLLYNQLSWHLAIHEADKLDALAHALMIKPRNIVNAEKEIFGTTLLQLSLRWSQWQTPMELLLNSLDSQQQPTIRELHGLTHADMDLIRRFNSRPATWVLFANQAAATLRRRGSGAMVHLRFISGLFRTEPQRAWHDLVENALFVAHHSDFTGQAAASLIWDQANRQQRRLTLPMWLSIPTAAPKIQPVPTAAAFNPPPQMLPDEHFLPQFIQELGQCPDLNHQLRLLVDSWHERVGINRIILLVFNSDRSVIRTLLRAGIDAESGLAKLQWLVGNNPLLAALIKQPSFLMIDSANQTKYQPHLPESLALHLRLPALLGSIMAGERPLALLVADCQGNSLSARQLQACRLSLPAMQKAVDKLRKITRTPTAGNRHDKV
ncbi:MAG: HDOD domain-containing protein [Pseudomonadales bacterium]|nr:HDOD domain-containing protein [Pseudomonadales bacterium]